MPTDAEAPPSPRDRWWTAGLTALLVLPLVVSAVYLWFSVGTSYVPSTDWALLELRMRDVLDHAVYVGPYSRYGWSHPGPLIFYLLAIPYKLTGSRSISMHITALFVNGLTIVGIAWVAFRRGRLPMVLAMLVPVGVLTHAVGADFLRNPWNPYLPVLPLLLLVLLAWSVAVGDAWMLPIAVGVASFTIQTHVGLAIDSVALLGVAVVGLVLHGRRRPEAERRAWWSRAGKVAGVSAAVAILLWFPTLWGTFVVGDGNLGVIGHFFRTRTQTAGLGTAVKALGLQWGPRPEWIFGPRGIGIAGDARLESLWWAAVWLILGAAATVVAVKRRATDTVWLAGLVAVGLIAALVAANGIVGTVFPYLLRWTWVFGAGLGILVLRGLWLAVAPERRAVVLRAAVPVAGVMLGVLCVMETVDALDAGRPFASQERRQETLDREVSAALPAGAGPVLIDSRGNFVATGLALSLERRGIPVEMAPENDVVYGSDRRPSGGPYRAQLVVETGAGADAEPPGRRIAYFAAAAAPGSRRAVMQYRAALRATPPGPKRDALIEFFRQSRALPVTDVSIYLVDPAADASG